MKQRTLILAILSAALAVMISSGTVAQIFDVRYLSTLFGIVFLSHQVGAFLGVWLGGRLYDTTGSYDLVWYMAIGLGVLASLVHMPISDAPVVRPQLVGTQVHS